MTTKTLESTTTHSFPVPKFASRGPLSELMLDLLRGKPGEQSELLEDLAPTCHNAIATSDDPIGDDDLQLSLLILHGLHYGEVIDTDDDWEWQPDLVAARVAIERAFEHELRERIGDVPVPLARSEDVAEELFDLTRPSPGPSVARFIAKQATDEQAREFVVLRSLYTLKEADAQTWTIPRLHGKSKAALVEIQTDEYGAGRPTRMHSAIFARLMRALGLDDTYASYVDSVPAETIASFTMMTMFGLNRRLRGASAGHYAAYEMTSSLPNRMLGDGFRRLGHDDTVTDYFDEHVEADAVHEQIAGRYLAGGLAEQEPHLTGDIIFGAHAAMYIDGLWAKNTLERWQTGESALRVPLFECRSKVEGSGGAQASDPSERAEEPEGTV